MRAALYVVVFMAAVGLLTILALHLTPPAVSTEPVLSANSYEVLVNQERARRGIPTLTTNKKLRDSACNKAQDMLARDYWSHDAPGGSKFSEAIRDSGYRYQHVGENLARNFNSADSTIQGWLDSPAHKDNLMGDYKEQGICTVSDNDTTITVQHLGSR